MAAADRDLADAVFRMYDPRSRWKSLYMSGTEWQDPAHIEMAWLKRVKAEEDDPTPEETVEGLSEAETGWRAWDDQRADRFRIEWGIGSEHEGTVVSRTGTWWARSSEMAPTTNGGSPHYQMGGAPYEFLVNAQNVLSSLSLEYLGRARVAERETFRRTSIAGRHRSPRAE
ncbi:MAG TPA: hypothetical protein VKG43_02860 [Acidimicrobiales bacterium]|nr:hypothetical protein [Acidimicrobiales bacterium]